MQIINKGGIHNCLIIWHHVWECDNEHVMHGLPYLEILKGWYKGYIFTKQHKMAHEPQTSYLSIKNAHFNVSTITLFWEEVRISGVTINRIFD